MPTDEAYDAVLKAFREINDQTLDQWRIYRDTVNRAISLLNHEVLEVVDRLDKNDADRGARQSQLDVTLHAIQTQQVQLHDGLDRMNGLIGQTTALLHTVMQKQDKLESGHHTMRNWQWIRLGTEIAVVLIIAAFLYGVSR